MHVACSQVGGLAHTPPVASDAPGRAQAETVDRAEDFNLNVDTCFERSRQDKITKTSRAIVGRPTHLPENPSCCLLHLVSTRCVYCKCREKTLDWHCQATLREIGGCGRTRASVMLSGFVRSEKA